MTSYSARQTYLYKIVQAVETDLKKDINGYGLQALGNTSAYMETDDAYTDLVAYCENLQNIVNSFNSDINKGISVHNNIHQILSACKDFKAGDDIGSTPFYHSGLEYSHTFYKCEGGTENHEYPVLLYTTEPTLESFEAAAQICYNWANTADDRYGSYSGADCANALPLEKPDVFCLAGRDHALIG